MDVEKDTLRLLNDSASDIREMRYVAVVTESAIFTAETGYGLTTYK